MILAAGVGERMLPLTATTPKPMLSVGGKRLLEWHIARLRDAGFEDLVINVSHLGEQIMAHFSDGAHWGVAIEYSVEDTPLETAGGIVQALPLLGDAPFLVVNGDIWTDMPFAPLRAQPLETGDSARLVFVSNPPQHPHGDFEVDAQGRVYALAAGATGVTYAGVGVYTPQMFAGVSPGKLALRPLLDAAIESGTLRGQLFSGEWEDVGTPERLQALDERLNAR